jgi:putative redox protein
MGSESSILATVIDPQAGVRIEATTEAGYPLAFETSDAGAARNAPEPTESLLAALAACTAMDVASILRKKRQRVTSYQIAVSGEKSDQHPQIYTRIRIEHRVSGELEPEALRRSIMLSATRYCPVNAMLSRSATIQHGYRLRREGRAEETALVAITGPEGATVL